MAFVINEENKVFFFDCPRSKQGDFIQYDFLKELKNGYFFYRTIVCSSNPIVAKLKVHVLIEPRQSWDARLKKSPLKRQGQKPTKYYKTSTESQGGGGGGHVLFDGRFFQSFP